MFGKKSPARSQAPQPSKAIQTYIAPNTELQGTLHVETDLLVDGIIHGTVDVRGNMEITQSGLVEGPELRAKNLTVHGVLKARVYVENQLTLTRTARLEGDVNATALSIEPGAFYIGYIETGDAKSLPASHAPELIPNTEPRQIPEFMPGRNFTDFQ